jgi:hypothetical protein
VVQARIWAIANIRHADSVAALVGMMRSGGRERVQEYMGDFRVGLMMLTGQDHGRSQDAWQAWWNENKKRVEVAPEAPRLPAVEQRAWEYFWGLPATYERGKKRGDRGREPERQ